MSFACRIELILWGAICARDFRVSAKPLELVVGAVFQGKTSGEAKRLDHSATYISTHQKSFKQDGKFLL